MTRRLPPGPTYRKVKGTRVAVEAIVICDDCGNREIGWLWRDQRGRYLYDGEAEPPYDLGSPGAPGYAGYDSLAEIRAAKSAAGRLETGMRTVFVLRSDDHLGAFCPKHGHRRSGEVVVLGDLSIEKVRRVRAYRSEAL